jgi:hypothetical protein
VSIAQSSGGVQPTKAWQAGPAAALQLFNQSLIQLVNLLA